ncbi:Ser/Thr protein phosphatase, putative [Entamoeba histolytica HM-1:IMSS-B]|uniref:Serine/threonine-protein phosphatase n=6 Tax=Entamoeba histolytica TaxID=5759 RepID=C4M299_ENTH1|nr:Ser/Thr protein phosphatase, putative [Entamoeba histolytica HM-1:IMSS]EMD44218.1 Serine/Threonine protein phosphatase, putative [Entamoeba histolytica KU27]EMH75183.1 Ser/Thr protein phosphatase, putative [Entamoeba histolytica HM-1:IMSS-B]EMS17979.1 Ser/Thr protein phosphatase [Entamoeba histolytica HM-3:IMSS]ENY62669.1 Ser/Thr protein phosphatase, putative [Entamoeba histolytica HM-1:IMSS-A]GAT95395.1 Ser Thr protein phosphatase putative [Entamoeba histolytica]|eukprot:XP_655244.1 Ser/Thr protein phosphatase, putative [Entamoeba histolytica HM-1:IMSS]
MKGIEVHKQKVKKFERPKLQKYESVASCTPANGEFLKTHQEYTPVNLGKRTIDTHYNVETRLLQKNVLFNQDGSINLTLLKNHFQREGKLTVECAAELISRAKTILSSEPNLLVLQAPIYVCGDIHGQFYDLLTIFDITKNEDCSYVFMGDYVDRGDFGCEVLFYLLAQKLMNPKKFFLLRGNHESRMMTENMTFNIECEYKYNSVELLDQIHSLFDCFPLAALIEGNGLGRFLCTHGGISPQLQKLSQYNEINRFQEPPTSGAMCDLLWSDPLDQPHPESMDKRRLEAWLNTDFVDNTLRQTSVMYGLRGLLNFLNKNDLICLVRAHQVMEDGFKLHYFMQNIDLPPCITVFSAPNYCDAYQNKASVLKINTENICFEQFEYVDHPFNFPDFLDCFNYSLPTLMESIVTVLSELVVEVKEEEETDIKPEEKQADAELKAKIDLLKEKTEKEYKEKKQILDLKKEIKAMKTVNKDWFDKVLRIDKKNEMRPRSVSLGKVTSRPRNVRTVSDSHLFMPFEGQI